MTANEFAPVTPGEMLSQEFLVEYGLSQNQLAKALGISPNRIAEIVANRRRITADTALRLSLYFGNSPEFWMNLQSHYDVKMARRKLKPQDAKRIKAQRRPRVCLCRITADRRLADGGVRVSTSHLPALFRIRASACDRRPALFGGCFWSGYVKRRSLRTFFVGLFRSCHLFLKRIGRLT